MSVLKFRVWDKNFQQMSPVANIHFGDDGDAKTIIVETAPEGDEYTTLEHGVGGFLMQFTGLTDRNDAAIYDGDIVEISTIYGEKHLALVKWGKMDSISTWENAETWLLHHYSNGREGALYPYCQPEHGFEIAVIGNRWEHLHLLPPTDEVQP